MTLVTVVCPVCESTDFAAMYPGTISDRTADPASYFSSSRERAGYFPIVRCESCRLVLQNPRDDAPTLARVYKALTDRVYDEEGANRTASAREHLSFVETHRAPPGALLDVGCATGLFVTEAQSRGWVASGIDASSWSVEQARVHCPAARFEVGTLESVVVPPESLDVVTLFDVLEHVHAPGEALTRIRRWLRPGGWLYLSLPNGESLSARLMRRRWVLLLREHLWYFSPDTLGRLLASSGYELVGTRTKWVTFSLANVCGRLAQYPGVVGGAAKRMAGIGALRRLTIRFPMGEMNVAARRHEG